MDFIIKSNESVVTIARSIGYVIIDANGIEYNLVRKLLGANYPRFHVYLKQQGDRYNFSLHLDQKQPSYSGSHAHSGEYDGPLVEGEADRIRQQLNVILNFKFTI